ncbi:MAG: radical SAM family heme chaperone HemW [Eubacterium sp.]
MRKLGFYIHIPFCQSKCRYCDFASWSGYSDTEIATYFEKLIKEIRLFAKKNNQIKVGTIYFGGGTPSYVNNRFIEQVMECIESCFIVDFKLTDERTIEMNPASLTLEKAQAYRKMGFNRVSIGLQATQNHLLRFLGRPHNWDDFICTYSALEKAGIVNISADLMFGLPGQTTKDVVDSVSRITHLPNIKHVSCYSLKVEKGTSFYTMQREGRLELPDEITERLMQKLLIEGLADHGFEQYEISNFAKLGFESCHNRSYWEMKPYVGFGLGAASYFNGKRWTNTFDMKSYLGDWGENNSSPVLEIHTLDEQEMKGDFMFLGLREMKGICDADYQKLFKSSFFDDFNVEIEELINKNLLEQKNDRVCLTMRGQDFANQVFMMFV